MATWYVRPNISHSGSRNGTSYATAWGGWTEIVWGVGGVTALDTLYICGAHSYSTITTVGNHTGTSGNEVTIRGDYAEDPGSLSYATATYLATRSHTKWLNLSISGVSRCMLSGTLTNHTMTNVSFFGGVNPIFSLYASTGNNYTDLSFVNCFFTGGGALNVPGSHVAFDWFCANTSAISTVTRLTFDSCVFENVNLSGTGRGVVGLRTEQDTDVSSIVSDLIFKHNTFYNCVGHALEALDGHSIGAASPQYGLWKGARVFNNKVYNQQVDVTRVLGGGFSLFGFSQSTSASFGSNLVSYNLVDGAVGQAGGVNVGYGTSIIEYNTFKNLSTESIDACGILIDLAALDCIVRYNHCENLMGKNQVINSGCAIMILNANNIQVYSNTAKNVKCGVFFGSMTLGNTSYVYSNTFIDCIDYGVFVSSLASRSSIYCKNNIFSSLSSSTTISIQDDVGGWTNEDYNYFSTSFLTAVNHTMGANNITQNPKLKFLYFPFTGSSAIAAGTYLGNLQDKNSSAFWNPPSIGAYEYIRPRTMRS